MLATILRQPLLHFLLFGALIFVTHALTQEAVPESESESEADAMRIVVDRAVLLDYLQYQAQVFDPDAFAARLDAMSPAEVDALAAAYVREEALYREGLRMNLDVADYDIRRRVVQKVEFLLEGLAPNEVAPTEAELQAFYEANVADYAQDAVYDFTHIFFDGQRDMAAARARAEALLADSSDIGFDAAAQHGDRYPFLQNYVERTRSFVASNFSADFVAQLDALVPGDSWQGPLQSRYGWHLVMLRARSEGLTPPFSELRERVLEDYRYEALLRSRVEAEARVIGEYAVDLRLD